MLNFSGCRAKIERAKKHINDFDRVRVSFLDSNPYICVPKFNEKESRTDFVLGPLPIMPVDLALTAGDAFHNLRSALDLLANEFVRNAGQPTNTTCFPICKSAQDYIPESKRKTKGMPASAKEFIDSLMPYRGCNDTLWGLHGLDIIDKHRRLVPIGTKIANIQISNFLTPTEISLRSTRCELEEGYLLGSLSGKVDADQSMKFAFDIAFCEPDVLAGKPVIETFMKMIGYIERIVSQLESHESITDLCGRAFLYLV